MDSKMAKNSHASIILRMMKRRKNIGIDQIWKRWIAMRIVQDGGHWETFLLFLIAGKKLVNLTISGLQGKNIF
ncbi:hypothetical protein DIU36_02250 [Mucilaginibacter rubeus]|nr:hypothetical protein DIU36_02250 [Mucilaginibacter rubeus]